MTSGNFQNETHKAFVVLIYYSGVRSGEALRAEGKQFKITDKHLLFDVGKRLKHGIVTPPLPLPLALPFMDKLANLVERSDRDFKLFSFSPKTAYNIFDRLGYYPHFCRLNLITNFFLAGWTIPQVHSWTGLTLDALNFYIGLVDVTKMGDGLLNGAR